MPADPLDKLVVFVPVAAAPVLIDALAAAGRRPARRLRPVRLDDGRARGRFEPAPAAHPAIGSVGEITVVAESRIEMVVPRAARSEVLRALRQSHPYEEPAFDLLPMVELTGPRGLGRIGELPAALTLAEFAAPRRRGRCRRRRGGSGPPVTPTR